MTCVFLRKPLFLGVPRLGNFKNFLNVGCNKAFYIYKSLIINILYHIYTLKTSH